MRKKIFVVAAIFCSSLVYAQSGTQQHEDDTTGKFLEEVVFTANKYPGKSSLTGKVLTVITRRQLEQSSGKNLSQILTVHAGININGANSNPGKDKSVYIRGAAVDHTLITIDGIPVYDPSGIGSNFDIRNIPVDNIERVEILKGSQSTLYGSDAIAGVINIITQKPGNKTFKNNGAISYGSYNSFRSHTGFSGKTGNIDYTGSYTYTGSGGINEAVNKNNSAVTDKDGFNQHNLQADLGIQVKKIRMQPFIRFNNIDGRLDQGAFTDELDYTFKQKSLQAGLRNEISLGETKIYIVYNYNHIDRIYIDDSTRSRNGFNIYSHGAYKGREHFADAYCNIPAGNRIKFTAGADFRKSNSDQDFFSVGIYGPYHSIYSSDSLEQEQVSFYATINLNSPGGLNMELGNRLNIHSSYGTKDVFNFNPSFLYNKKLKIFANLSTGYRTPSLYQLFSEFGNANLRPESAFTMEGGLQYYESANKFTARATGFIRNVKDLIFFYFDPATFQSQYINQGRQKDHGLELEAFYHFTGKISLKVFYTYVNGKITTEHNNKDTTYYNLLRRPKNSFDIYIGSQLTDRFYFSAGLQARGKRKDIYFDPLSFQETHVTLDSYFLLDLYTEYAILKNRLKFFADFRNITGSKYTEVSGFNTTGFNVTGGLRWEF